MASAWSQGVAVVRRSVDAFNRRDIAAAIDAVHREGAIVPVPNYTPPGTVYRGQAGAESYFRAVFSVTPDLYLEPQEFRSLGDRLLVKYALVESPGSPDGTVRETAALHAIADGRIMRVQGFASEAEAYEAAGRPAAGELRALYEMAPAPIVILDDDARILDANAAAGSLYGVGVEELRGRSMLELVASSSVRRAEKLWRSAMADGEGVEELALISETGERPAEVRARANVGAGRHMAVLIADRARTPRPGAPRLTPREREIFRLLAHGLNAREISDLLRISVNTVRTHVRNATVKLEARSRVQAVAVALVLGEIEGEGDLVDSTYVQKPAGPSSSGSA